MWMKVDDGLHAHRKTRTVIKSHDRKRRDAAPMGIWVLAGSWAAQNGTDGWVPEDELDRWDEEWLSLVGRLVRAGYWWPQERDGEPGYGFNDWHDYNDPADLASKSGTYGNHVRWHVNEKRVEPGCEHCPTEPEDRGDVAPESGGDRGATSGGDSHFSSPPIALPEPEPEPGPNPTRGQPSADPSAPNEADDPMVRFEEFWDTYGHKVKRPMAEKRWRLALKKPGVTADLLIATASAYVLYERQHNEGGRFIAHPSSWLNQERWRDERTPVLTPATNVQRHLQLAAELAERESGPRPPQPLQIGYQP